MTDKQGFLIEVGMQVEVPCPNESDIHNFDFVGTVEDILDDRGTAIIIDGDGDFFEIECDRLTVVND